MQGSFLSSEGLCVKRYDCGDVPNRGFRVQVSKCAVNCYCGMHTRPCLIRDTCSFIWCEVDAGAQVPGCPSPLRSPGGGEDWVFCSESGGGTRVAQVGDNARVETEGQGPLGQYFQGNCRRRGLKAPAQHGKMDGGIRLTEAAQGFLFAGSAGGEGGRRHLTLLPAVLPMPLLSSASLIRLRQEVAPLVIAVLASSLCCPLSVRAGLIPFPGRLAGGRNVSSQTASGWDPPLSLQNTRLPL